MGAVIEATCPCGYAAKRLAVGAGMITFRVLCEVPALCVRCRAVVNAEVAAAQAPVCPRCSASVTPYGEFLSDDRSGHADQVASWNLPHGRHYTLGDHAWRCPRCDERSLFFELTGWCD